MPAMTASVSVRYMVLSMILWCGSCTTACLSRATSMATIVRVALPQCNKQLTGTDHGVWRRMGDTILTLYAEGIHCEDTFDEPLFLRESRRRIYAATYRSDKSLATFFGRPPMMNWRYSDRKQPLDLDDEQVSSDDPEIVNDALSKLDVNGWNTESRILPSSWIRVRTHTSVIKERILELSLAGHKVTDL